MRGSGTSWRVAMVVLIVVGLVAVTVASDSGSVVQAQAATDFSLQVSSTNLPASGGTAEVVVTIDPGESAVAALGATVTVDTGSISVVECVPLVGLGSCGETAPGIVNVQTVDPTGWASPTDLFRITYDVSALTSEVPIEIELLEAFDVGGILIAGSITGGTIGIALNGDVDCDNVRTIGDALIIAQYVVGLRTAATCPLPDPRTQIDLTTADVNRDDFLDIGDALLVARCTVGLLNCDE